MAVEWEIDLFFEREQRDPETDAQLEPTHWYGLPVYKRTVKADSYEHGASGTLVLYYEDEDNEGKMGRTVAVKDPDLVGIDARQIGEHETVDPEDIAETADEWEQDAQ